MKRLYIFIFLVGLLGNNIMYAQIPASSQSLPSPNVAALGLYGEIPVSKFTGMPDISVPIYEVPVGDFKLPFSLHYHAAGIRPDQHPGWVGMGWNLNTGGVVSRTVKGKPDDCNVKNHTYLMNMGYYFHSETLNTPQWNTQDYLKETGFFVKFGGNLFFISPVFFFLNPIKSCRYVCFLVTLKTPHH